MDLLSAGTSGLFDLAGGFLDRKHSRDQAEQNIAVQKEFAQNSIQWRVNDAKAAGVHPGVALGAQGASFSPNPITAHFADSFSRMGQNVGQAMARNQDTEGREYMRLQRQLLAAQLEKVGAETDAINIQSMQALTQQPGAHGDRLPQSYPVTDLRSEVEGLEGQSLRAGSAGRVIVNPDEQIAHQKGSPENTAGLHPGWREYIVHAEPGKEPVKMLAPVNEEGWSEGLESIPMEMRPMWYAKNVRKYGWRWLWDIQAGGKSKVQDDRPMSERLGFPARTR